MKFSQIVLVIALAAVTSFCVVRVAGDTASQESKKETAFDRVMRTQTLRCGYIVSPPFLAVDLKTGVKSGLAFDFVSALGKELDIKVDWVEEATWGTFQEGLKAGRYDAMCTPLWEAGTRAKMALYTKPLYDCNLSMVARADDARFDDGLKSLNNDNVTILTVEGDISGPLREKLYPLTKELALPPGTDDGQYFMNIATKKADVGFAFEYRMKVYNEASDVKLKPIGQNEPVRSYGSGLTVAHGEADLKFMLDSAINTVLKSGEAKEIISRYPGFSLPTAY